MFFHTLPEKNANSEFTPEKKHDFGAFGPKRKPNRLPLPPLHTIKCAMVKSRYIGDGHPTFNRNPYNGYINPYYWADDHPLLYGNNGNLDPGTNECPSQRFTVGVLDSWISFLTTSFSIWKTRGTSTQLSPRCLLCWAQPEWSLFFSAKIYDDAP